MSFVSRASSKIYKISQTSTAGPRKLPFCCYKKAVTNNSYLSSKPQNASGVSGSRISDIPECDDVDEYEDEASHRQSILKRTNLQASYEPPGDTLSRANSSMPSLRPSRTAGPSPSQEEIKVEEPHRNKLDSLVTKVSQEPRARSAQQSDIHRVHFLQTIQALNFINNGMQQVSAEDIEHMKVDLPPPRHAGQKKVLIFDMDETLIHCVDDIETQ